MKNANKILALLALAFCTISTTFAATRTWNGNTSTAWGTNSNWSGNAVPNSGDDVIIPTGLSRYPLLSANTTVASFTMNGGTFSTNNFTLSVTNTLTITAGTFSANRNVSAGAFTQSGGTYSGSGTTTLTVSNNFTLSTGTFNAPGNISTNGFTLTSGTFTLNNRNLSVSNNIVINNGTFTAGTGTITASNFTQNNGSFTFSNGTMTIGSNYILNNGTFDAGTSTVEANNFDLNNGTFIIEHDRIALGNNFTLDGALLEFTGTGDITIDDDFFFLSGSIDMNFNNLRIVDDYTYTDGTIANNGDSIVANDIILDFTGEHGIAINLRARSSVTFTDGILVTSNAYMLTFDYNATASGMSATRHVKGPVRKRISSTNTTPTFVFPIGNGSVYAPLEISSYQSRRNEDYFTAEYFYGRHPNAGGSKASGIDHVSQAEYWILDRGTTSGTATTTAQIRLAYDENTRSGQVTDATRLNIVRWSGSQWENLGRGGSSTGNNTTGTTISNTRPSSFSPFTFGSSTSANPLPITLLNFNALPVQNAVNVTWTTTSEINNDFFTVEKSVNGTEWTAIGTVEAVGNSEKITNYSYLDINATEGVQYYRLKQTDVNGDFTYSKIAVVKFNTTPNTVNVYPNPANSTISIELSKDLSADVTVNVINTMGQVVLTASGIGSNQAIDIQNLDKGVYYIEIVTEGNISKTKFIKN